MESVEMRIIQIVLASRLNLNDRTPDSEDIERIHDICGVGVKYLMMSGVSSLKFMYENGLDTNKYEILN